MKFKKYTTLVLITDGAQARVFENVGPKIALNLIEERDSQGARTKTSELLSDSAGRSFDRGGPGRHQMEADTDAQEVEKEKFLRELIEDIDKAAYEDRFDQLVIVAPPQRMGFIRDTIGKSAEHKLIAEITKDLANTPEPELPDHLDGIKF